MKMTCPSCDIEYSLTSNEAKEEGIEPLHCPFCGFETAQELNLSEPDYSDAEDEDDDWDNWHPDDRF